MDEVFTARADGTVHRNGDNVRRPLQPWSGAVHAFLGYLAAVGFTAAPPLIDVEADT